MQHAITSPCNSVFSATVLGQHEDTVKEGHTQYVIDSGCTKHMLGSYVQLDGKPDSSATSIKLKKGHLNEMTEVKVNAVLYRKVFCESCCWAKFKMTASVLKSQALKTDHLHLHNYHDRVGPFPTKPLEGYLYS